MKAYRITIINGYKAVALMPTYFLIIIGSLTLTMEFNSSYWKLSLISGAILFFGIVFYRICVGKMSVLSDNQELTFQWIRKPLFYFKKLPSFPLKQLETVIIDQDQIIRKLYYKGKMVRLNTWRPKSIYKDNNKEFLEYMYSLERKNRISIIDSWDEWYEKGYLRIAYWINISMLIIFGMLIFIALIIKGADSIYVVYLIFPLFQLLIHHQTMKSKMKKETGGNKRYN